ncbi:type II toxin-antitoxin system HicB family antitoxin [Thermosipho sp. 1074]|uniref:type II toxin-antitoxin system HicB family antitoxin n=1 Tax=Thermosipho sp. 1074 TaxID=1643331 RepID=UPI0018E99387|nr:type II toxin-antitoxin system HicB family antitoxin [Thermosipho sp. 1074]
MLRKYRILVEPEETGGYHAWCPALPGCHVQGETKEEALNNLKEAIELYIESLKARKEFFSEAPSK